MIDAPVFEFFERDRNIGHRAAHEGAGLLDPEISVQKTNHGLASHGRGTVEAIEQSDAS